MSILITKTRVLLADRPRTLTYAHIGEAIDVKVRWLEAFAADESSDYSCHKVEKLYELLSGKSLNV